MNQTHRGWPDRYLLSERSALKTAVRITNVRKAKTRVFALPIVVTPLKKDRVFDEPCFRALDDIFILLKN